MKPISFGQETIYARELTYLEYEEYARSLRANDKEPFWDRLFNLLIRHAVREDGTRRFQDRSELVGLPSKTVLKAAYAFSEAFTKLNLVTDDDIDELRKN